MPIRPVILSGGSGTRLWPSSRKSLPKQFIEFPGTGSLFARTLNAPQRFSSTEPVIISSRQHGFLCRRAVQQLNLEAHCIFEETGRNTAPAIYFAALASDPNDILLIMPSDHWIEKLEVFTTLALRGAEICETGGWVTFGITPTTPAIGYGYIEVEDGDGHQLDVRSFIEKPDLATAKTYLKSERHFWNFWYFHGSGGSLPREFPSSSARTQQSSNFMLGRPHT